MATLFFCSNFTRQSVKVLQRYKLFYLLKKQVSKPQTLQKPYKLHHKKTSTV